MKMMKDLFFYMYYRTARFYKFFGEYGYESVGMIILLGSFSFYFIAILYFLFTFPCLDELAGLLFLYLLQ